MKILMKWGKGPALALAVLITHTSVAAQEPSAPPPESTEVQPGEVSEMHPADPAIADNPASPDQCELHVWGGERMQSMTTGWLSGFGAIGGAIDGAMHASTDARNRSALGEALATPGQVAALAAADLPALLQLPNYRVVTHDEPMDPAVANRNRNRHASSASRCYAELMVTRVFYHRAAIYGRSLRTSFLFRQFDAASSPQFTFAGRGGNGLSVFPPREETEVAAANAELLSVFRANFEEYARNLTERRRGRR